MHTPNGDAVPDTREPGGDRSFLPIDSPEVWIVQGDPTVYTTNPR
jgi:alpha-amylase